MGTEQKDFSLRSRPIFSWALYDWANSTYATSVLVIFFPIFFREFWAKDSGLSSTDITYYLGLGNSIASLCLVFLAPILGAIADQLNAKKRLLSFFAFFGITSTGYLYFVQVGQWEIALAAFILSHIGFLGANIFYDSLLPSVAPKNKIDLVSGFGFGLGYLSGGLLLAFHSLLIENPQWIGATSTEEAVLWAFLSVAVWWAVFSIPILLFVEEPQEEQGSPSLFQGVVKAFSRLTKTAKEIRSQQKKLFYLLIAYFFYIDGVYTVMKMSVNYGKALGFDTKNLVMALLLTQFIGFPSAILFGKFAEKKGPVLGLYTCIIVYAIVTIWAFFMSSVTEFIAMAMIIGVVQGGVQSLSRSYMASFVPAKQTGEYFGFFNMVGKTSAIFGPLLVGWVAAITGNERLSILSLIVLFIIGLVLLRRVSKI